MAEPIPTLKPFVDTLERLAPGTEVPAASVASDLRRILAAGDDDGTVLLPRSDLFEFLGAVALPPWPDKDGRHTLGGDTPCAPIAERLSAWVDEHELTRAAPAQDEPLLGLATTRELLEEVVARFDVSLEHGLANLVGGIVELVPPGLLAYRTVDGQ